MGLEKETPPLMSAQVRVFRSLGHRPAQRVYRQSWTGQLLADFETAAHGQQCRLFILAARTSGHYVAVRTSVENQTDFSIDYFTSPWPLVHHVLDLGVAPEYVEALALPCPWKMGQRLPLHQVAAQAGSARLVCPLNKADACFSHHKLAGSYHVDMQLLPLTESPLLQAQLFQLHTQQCVALPIMPLWRQGFFNVHYVLRDDPTLRVVHSHCVRGHTSFGVTRCDSPRRLTIHLQQQGVMPETLAQLGLTPKPYSLQAYQQVKALLQSLG